MIINTKSQSASKEKNTAVRQRIENRNFVCVSDPNILDIFFEKQGKTEVVKFPYDSSIIDYLKSGHHHFSKLACHIVFDLWNTIIGRRSGVVFRVGDKGIAIKCFPERKDRFELVTGPVIPEAKGMLNNLADPNVFDPDSRLPVNARCLMDRE